MKKSNQNDKPWKKAEGVFPGPNGKFLVSVKSTNNGTPFSTLSQHVKKEEAYLAYDQYLKKQQA